MICQHVSYRVPVPQSIVVSEGWSISSKWLDFDATLTDRVATSLNLHTLFKKSGAFPCDVFQQAATTVAQALASEGLVDNGSAIGQGETPAKLDRPVVVAAALEEEAATKTPPTSAGPASEVGSLQALVLLTLHAPQASRIVRQQMQSM